MLVLSEEGELPIAGARITAFEDPPPPPAETDASGRCELQVAPSSETIRLRVEKEGFFHASANYYRQERLTIRLEHVVTLFGSVPCRAPASRSFTDRAEAASRTSS